MEEMNLLPPTLQLDTIAKRGKQARASLHAYTGERVWFNDDKEVHAHQFSDDGREHLSTVVTKRNTPSRTTIAASNTFHSHNANKGILVCESDQPLPAHLNTYRGRFAGAPGASRPDSIVASVNGYRLSRSEQLLRLRAREPKSDARTTKTLNQGAWIHYHCSATVTKDPWYLQQHTVVGTYHMGEKIPGYPGLYQCEITLDHAKIARMAALAGNCDSE